MQNKITAHLEETKDAPRAAHFVHKQKPIRQGTAETFHPNLTNQLNGASTKLINKTFNEGLRRELPFPSPAKPFKQFKFSSQWSSSGSDRAQEASLYYYSQPNRIRPMSPALQSYGSIPHQNEPVHTE